MCTRLLLTDPRVYSNADIADHHFCLLSVRPCLQLDKDASGTISLDELSQALQQFGVYDDAKALLASADTNGDGMIDFREFTFLMREKDQGLKKVQDEAGRTSLKGLMSRF